MWLVCTFLLEGGIANDGVVDCDSGEVVIDIISQVEESIGNVRYVETSIALPCEVDLAVFQAKCFGELLVEAGELLA